MQALKMPEKVMEASQDFGLITDLLASLDENKIQYCHWKSNWRIDRWLGGDG